MSKTTKQIPSDNLDLYTRLIETNPNIELKGASMPYTSLNGHMFSFLSESGLGIRLPKEVREEFLKKHATTLYKTRGTILKEYVAVPDKLLKNTKELKKYFDLSYEYVSTLKPKPSKKKSR
jgi:TfoX/Sxy family transcriptional regulator of competence genes